MKTHLILCLLITITSSIFCQTVYKDSLFLDVKKTTYTYDSSNNEVLKFDYYFAQGAPKEAPLVVYVHGGGFMIGERDRDDIIKFCTQIAHRGYAVASVSYRLTMKDIGFDCNTPAHQKIGAINAASDDVDLAIKYILDNNQLFNINKNKVIISGSSAGAETVLNMAYVYKNNILPSNFNYAGIISMAGAVTTVDNINTKTAIPTQLFHGTGDRLVPYRLAAHHYCYPDKSGFLMLYGSHPIAKRLQGLGTSCYLYTVEGGSHDWSGLPMTLAFDEIMDFLYNDIINIKSIRQTNRILQIKNN